MAKSAKPPYLGAAYYPEDWPLEMVDEDIRLMKQAGMNAMRIGEFAWSRMEPEEGWFDFAWLHTVVDKLGRAGIATILGTPSATPPFWTQERYPEIVQILDNGRPMQHGARRHSCPNSPTYRRLCRKIAEQMGSEFGRDTNVIGWQIDNEVYPTWPAARGCHCPVCVRGFQEYLAAKYGTIAELNKAWCLTLWSMEYPSFGSVVTPRTDIWHHPSLLTEWATFMGESYIEFVHEQVDELRKLTKAPIGTDMMSVNGVNWQHMNRGMDVVQFNHYDGEQGLHKACFWMDFARPMSRKPFWNTETHTCWNGSTTANGYKSPGFCRANSWLPVALGGEANLYWLWRAHSSGQELMHGSVVSSSGRPLHIIGEVQEVSRGLARAAEFLNGSKPVRSGLAIHTSGWAWSLFEYQSQVNKFKYADRLCNDYYQPLIAAQWRPDVIDPEADLAPYKIVCSPFLPTLAEGGLQKRLAAWIRTGGVWIAGPLTDNRDMSASKFTHAPYGVLEEWAGAYTKYQIPGDPTDFSVRWCDGGLTAGSLWYDGFELRGGTALATYADGPLEGLAGVVGRKMGKGKIVVLGTLLRPDALTTMLGYIAREAGMQPVAKADENLLVVPRAGKAGKGMVAVELENKPATLELERPGVELISGKNVSGEIAIPPYGVVVVKYE